MFNDDFDKRLQRQIGRTQKLALIGIIVSAALSLCMLAFIGWVVVMLMRHFGVV